MKPHKILFLDLEVNNNPYFGAIASPRHPDNYVVMNGWAIDERPYSGTVESVYYNSKEEAEGWLKIPDDVWLVVAHNAPFELDWMLHQERDELMRFLKRGGRFFCTAYAHYLLSNQQDTYPSLDQIAPLYGGTHKVDGIKVLWDQGVLTKDIDRDLLTEYLAGPGGDIDNTRKVFYGQVKKLNERGMWQMALTRMEGLLFCAFGMDAGLFTNRDVAFGQMNQQCAELKLLQDEFARHRLNFPADCVFKESSDFHMSAWLYGGPLKYKARVPALNDDGSHKYEKADFYKYGKTLVKISDIESNLVDAVEAEFEFGAPERYKAGKNKGEVKVFREDTDEIKLKWGDLIYDCPGLVPLNLLPDDLRKEFDREFTGKRTLSDDSPVFSTGKDALEMLSLRQEFPADVKAVLTALLKFAKLDKDLSTYYLREKLDEDGNVLKQSGMLQYLNDLGYVHHNLNMTSTVTGRLSSNKPNFQNLPRGGTSDVKKMFTSRFGADGVIIEADYSALEVVTLAAFSKDVALTKALLDGIDMHCMRLAGQLNEPYEEVLKKCKDQTHPQFKEYDEMRTAIKPKAFAYQYGATAHGIAFATGCTVADAQKFIDTEKALFPDVERFYDDQITPIVEASSVRHREEVDGVWRLYCTGTWQAQGGTTYEFRQFPKTEWIDGKKQSVMQYKPTQIRNYPIQGESGFFVQGVCGLVVRWLIEQDFFGGKVCIINTVHDALYFDCHKDVLDVVCENVKRIMESLPQYFNSKHGYDLNVPFPAAVEFGASMFQKLHWHPGVLNEPATQEKLQKHLDELEAIATKATQEQSE